MGQGASPADAQVAARHSFEDETMRTSDMVSCVSALGVNSLVRDQLLSFRSYALQNSSNEKEKERERNYGSVRNFQCETRRKEKNKKKIKARRRNEKPTIFWIKI